MELAAHWHRCQNLPKKRVTTSRVYRERDDPVKDVMMAKRKRPMQLKEHVTKRLRAGERGHVLR